MGRTACLVLTVPLYAVIALLAAVIALTTFSLGQNPTLVQFLLRGTIPLENRVIILINQYPFVGTNFTVEQGVIILLVAVLVGVNLAMVAYYFREHGISIQQGGSGTLGIVFGTLGAGCAACGSVLLAGVLSLFGVTASATLFPFDGLGIAVVALLWIFLSIYWVADGMRGGEVNGCPVDIYTR